MMDEAFLPLSQMLAQLAGVPGEIYDAEAGVRSYVRVIEVESPIELDVVRGEDGTVSIGSVPPLYRVNTSFRPSYHSIRILAECDEPLPPEEEDEQHG